MSTYCVICRKPSESNARMIRFFLSAVSADRAVFAVASENPECRVLGIEPGNGLAAAQNGLNAA